ncbi:hypothetical protein DFJ77DRAFT_86217 [Powellomyces hirtus]|nr:hypothetical protein DFJ77DRAFT_86217 [Powellomyces hirtus]
MARIKRSPPKRLSPLSSDVKGFATALAECPEAEIAARVQEVDSWPFPKTDFFHWIPVLNRFDAILETMVEEYDLKNMQSKDFTAEHKALLLAVLALTTHLWKNCTNRSLYNSYEHLNELLYTRDLDVLTATIRLVLRPAQRLGSQRSVRNNLGTAQERIAILAQHWGTKQLGLELEDLLADDTNITSECTSLHFQFYRNPSTQGSKPSLDLSNPFNNTSVSAHPATPSPATPALATPAPATPAPATPAPATPANLATPSRLAKSHKGASDSSLTSGLTVIHLADIHSMKRTDKEILMELVEQYHITDDHKFPLLQKIRIALGMNDVSTRRKLLTIRMLSIAVLVILGNEDLIQSRLFTFEPDLIQRLADVLQKDARNEANIFEVQAACLHALDSMAHHRSRLSEVLTAVNASANHGILMFILRKVISSMDSDVPTYPLEFVDALFGFVAYIASTQSGGNMIISAGVLPILIQLMSNTRAEQVKPVTRCILLLDSLVFGFTTSFAPFTAANGLEILVQRIQDEVTYCVNFTATVNPQGADLMEGVTRTSCSGTPPATVELPHERTALLRSLLKFVLHMMQTSGTADRMRNLIDTTLPSSLLTIFEQTQVFGASVFGLAVNIMSTFIHNEPTCLSILQEAKLPQALLTAISNDVPISAEVISALPNAFGAICLNQQGLDQFNAAKPIGKYLQVLTSEEHIRTLQDNDVPHLIGNSMDELIRHHPSVKDYVMASIIEMLQRVVAIGQESTADDTETATLHTVKADQNLGEGEIEKKDSRISQFIDLTARFLEGLFQNVAHCKDFIKMDGVQLILKCYTLPTLPYDFATSASSYSLSYLFRILIEVNPTQVVGYMLTEIQQAVDAAEAFLNFKGLDSLIANYIDLKEEDTDRLQQGQRIFRSLISLQGFIRLLSDIYCTHVLSHNKSVQAAIQTFSGDIGGKLIASFGAIYRTCVWENLLLKDTVPKQWYQSASKKTDKPGLSRGSIASALLDVDVLDSVLDGASTGPASGAASTDACSDNDPRVGNTRYFKHLLSQIPTVLTPTLQGILKLLTTTNRRIPDASSRKSAQIIVDEIALLLRDHLTWDRPSSDTSVNKYSYLAVVLGFVSVMFVEDRSGLILHTSLVVAFHKLDGTQRIFDVLESLWAETEELSARPNLDQDASAKEVLTRMYGALELALNALQTLSNGKLVHDSPLTSGMISREKDKTSPDYFDPYEYVTDIRTRMAPLVLRLWRSAFLKRAPVNVVKSVLAIVTNLMKAEGEVKGETASSHTTLPSLASSIFSRHAIVPDEDKVRQLVDMGFPRGAAETALVRCGNHVGRAAEYLIMHPNVVATASYSSGPEPTTPSTPAAAASPASATDAAAAGSSSVVPEPETPTDTSATAGGEQMDTSENTAASVEDPELAAALAMSMGSTETADPKTTTAAPTETQGSEEPAAMEVDPISEPPKDKGKGKAVDENVLANVRAEFKADIPQSSLALLDNVEESVIFAVKELFCLVGQSDVPGTIKFLVNDIERCRDAMIADSSTTSITTKQFAVRLRLFTLIVSDANWQKGGIESSQPLIGCLLQMTSADGINSAPWLPSALLVLESYISLSDEPKSVPLQYAHETKKEDTTNAGASLKPLSMEERGRLLQSLVSLLALESIDKEMLHAVMRLTVRLTRSHGIAIEFARAGGVPLLFNATRIGQFLAQPAMTVMILRHIIEDSAILSLTMKREIVHWFSHPRPRTVDISTFLKNHSHLVSRDLETFLAAVTESCMLPKYEPLGKPSQIGLQAAEVIKDTVEEAIPGDEVEKPADETSMDVESFTAKESSAPQIATALETLKSAYMSDLSEMVVQFLVSELLSLKNSSNPSSPSDLAAIPMTPQAGNAKSKDAVGPEPTHSTETQLEKTVHMQRCFLLQCLSELVVSYPTCKVDVIHASQKRNKGTPHKSSGRNPFLNHLVQDLLPHSLSHSQPETPIDPTLVTSEEQRDILESNWTTSVVSGLCLGVTADTAQEKKKYPDLVNVRRCVLDVIARSLRETINHPDLPTDMRYSRFLGISDLCFKILTARGPASGTGGPGSAAFDDIPTHVARMMLEKGFVNLLTQALTEIDIHHPQSSKLISAILKPIEFLTKLAIKLGKSAEPRSAQAKSEAGTVAVLPNDVVHMEETNNELSDMYRNSALGMYNAPTSDDDLDEDDSDDSDDDEGYDDFSDEELTDGDEIDDDEGSDVDDDMEIVVPQPYQGNPDPSSEEDEEDDEDDLGSMDDGEFDDEHDEEEDEIHADSDSGMSWNQEYHDLNTDTGDNAGRHILEHDHLDAMDMMVVDENDEDDANEHDVLEMDHEHQDSEGEAQDPLDDDEEDSEEDEGDDIGDMYEEDDFIDGEDEDGVFVDGTHGARLPRLFGGARNRTRRLARRQIMEVDVAPGGGLDIHWVPDDGGAAYPEAGDFQVLGRPLAGRPQAAIDDGMAHPLLVNQSSNTGRTNARDLSSHRGRGPAGVRNGDVLDWQAFDDLIGGNALQILEHLFYRGDRMGGGQLHQVDVNVNEMNTGMAPGGLVAGLAMGGQRRGLSVGAVGEGSSQRPAGASERTSVDDQVTIIHGFAPMGTAERWWQEARLMYGTVVHEKGARAANAVINVLTPAALEAYKQRKEAEEKQEKARQEAEAARKEEERKLKLEEGERKKKEEEERKAQEAAAAAAAVDAAASTSASTSAEAQPDETTTAAADQMDVQPEAAAPPAPEPEPRRVVTVNGTEYDITGTGIDVTFLEALPADLQQDVIDQHLRDQRRSQQVTEVPSDISSEFLDALPAELREEVLSQQRREQERRARASGAASAAPSANLGPVELDPASFLATLDPGLRHTVLSEQDDGFLATLPPALVAEANAFRGNRSRSRLLAFQNGPSSANAILANLEGISSNKRLTHREAVHLLDKHALMTLIRMLFLPEPVGITLLHRTLVNLCENSKTRTELVSLLLSILADGSTDLASVDRGFSQLSLKGKGKHTAVTPRKSGATQVTPPTPGIAPTVGENVPNLVAQRCLEALSQIISYNENVAKFFLMESDLFSTSFPRTPKKSKGKEKAVDYKYPVVVLLSLLQRSAFLNSSVLMERLMHILSMILRLLSFMNNKAKESREAKMEAKPVDSSEPATDAANPTGQASASTSNAAEGSSEVPVSALTPKKPPAGSIADFKAPVIPEQYVSAVVNVLTAGVCSGKSFQYTLSVVQHLFSMSINRDTITRELTEAAQRLGDAMVPELDELVHVLQTANTAVEVQGATLGKFTQPSAQQAKLLRVLKTIDFIHSKGKSSDKHVSRTETLANAMRRGMVVLADGMRGRGTTETPESEIITPADDAMAVSSIDDVLTKAKDALTEDSDTRLFAIYDKLQLPKLWHRLGVCLTLINEKEAFIHVATVLLPAIESFMVVSKPYVLRKRSPIVASSSTQAPALTRATTHQIADLEAKNNEELFVAFTEEHRKILNTMVRNSPSLMSGSFSLLVHNPKVLEFDNKRTYFNLQLHKRSNRDHYGSLQINVRRANVFEDSYHQLQGRSGDEIKLSKLHVKFHDEEGVDAGGVTREWFSVLARQMFNPDYALFRPSAADKVTYQPNRLSGINPDHLLYFKFVGRIIGKAIYDGRLLDAYFTRSFYKAMIDAPVDYKDMEAVDPEFHKSLEWILQNDITDVLDLTFSTEIDEFGKKQTIDLKPDGHNTIVTEQNKNEYVKLIVEQRLLTAIRAQIDAFLSGFHDVIPSDLVKIFNEQELELLISGMPDIDIDDWKNNTEYQNYTPSSPQVQWFWRAVRSFSQEERAKLVQFATGTSKVPLEGFAQLQGSNGVQKFQIHKDFSSAERLPSAHTCFNQLDLPLYESYEQLRSSLLVAISEGATGFGFV